MSPGGPGGVPRSSSPAPLLWAAGVVDDQHDVDAVGLQQVHEEAAVALGVQAHAPGMLGCQSFVLTGGHLQQRLEYPVVLLEEKPAFPGQDTEEGGQKRQEAHQGVHAWGTRPHCLVEYTFQWFQKIRNLF